MSKKIPKTEKKIKSDSSNTIKERDPSNAEIKDLKEKLSLSQKTAESYLDQLKRLRAEFENYSKRMQKKADSNFDSGMKELAGELLVVLNNFERAVNSKKIDLDGITLIAKDFFNILKARGLKRIDAELKEFDHNFHHAVSFTEIEIDSSESEGKIVEVIEPGYLWKDELLKPAMVVVGKKRVKSEE